MTKPADRVLWLNPVSGISGDMLLGALIDLGAPVEEISEIVASTGLDGWELDAVFDRRHGVPATKADVRVTDTATHRHARDLFALVDAVSPAEVGAVARRALEAVVAVEAHTHDESPDELHLHELGGHDAVVDLVGVAAALHLLGVTRVVSAPLRLGTGMVQTRHGLLPSPAPATLALLEGMAVESIPTRLETVTPTGAALLRAVGCTFGALPRSTVLRTGYGAGTKVLDDRPNVLVATLCEPLSTQALVEDLVLVETTVDDVTGELLGHLVAASLEAGALDAWVTPVLGKKGRPAHVVTILGSPEQADVLQDLLLRETGSLGARRTTIERHALPRDIVTVDVDGHPVRVKRGPDGQKPEHDDVAAVARATGEPLRRVADRATRAADD
jgi:uncharacterized protein (TIGR00299 family) protein